MLEVFPGDGSQASCLYSSSLSDKEPRSVILLLRFMASAKSTVTSSTYSPMNENPSRSRQICTGHSWPNPLLRVTTNIVRSRCCLHRPHLSINPWWARPSAHPFNLPPSPTVANLRTSPHCSVSLPKALLPSHAEQPGLQHHRKAQSSPPI